VNSAYAAWRAFQERVVAPAAAVLLVAMTLLALLEVVRRYVFGYSFEWQQDAVTFFTLSGIFLYFSVAQLWRSHLSVTVLPELLAVAGPRGRLAAELVRALAAAFAFLFLLAVVWWGIPEVRDSLEFESRTESLVFPMWPFLLALLLGFGFMALTLAFQVYFAVQRLRGKPVPEEPVEHSEH
jgi:TRAP-type C4-dicarboxylate transport system permease small subunit